MGILGSIAAFPGFAWIKAHEKLLIVILCLLAGLHFWSKGLDAWEKHDQKQLAGLQQQLDADKTAAAALASQHAQDAAAAAADKASYQQVLSTVQAQNAALVASITARDKATQNQQKVDLTANLGDLSKRFIALVPNVNPADLKDAPDGKSVQVGLDTAQKTVAQLELVPQLQADLKDEQTTITNLNSEIKSLQTYNTALEHEQTTSDKEIAMLNKELADADKTCNEKIAIEQVKTKKAFMHGFKWGAILGFFGGLFTGHAAAGAGL